MTTTALATLSQQCKIASEELHLMSNVLLCDLLQSLREYIGCLFQLSADVAELDLITSLARVSSLQTYVRPTFGQKLVLLDSRHPVLEVFGLDGPVPNNVNASVPWNFHVISGPNMSGKSTYLKQIVLLHIMSQIGCFVPARKATFRITDLIFCKIALRDDIECNASTFALEMKEAQYILRSVTPTSLIVLDELCKGTASEEGASIAWAICERLLNTTAFVFVATHFAYLTKLAELYYNVTNHYFETISGRATETNNCCQLTYTHRLKCGVAPTDDYGIVLAESSGLPKSVTEKARKYASERLIVDRVTIKPNTWEQTCYGIVVKIYELFETNKFDRVQVTRLLERIVMLQKQGGKDEVEDEGTTKNKEIIIEKSNEDKGSSDCTPMIAVSRNCPEKIVQRTVDDTVICVNNDLIETSVSSPCITYTDIADVTYQTQNRTFDFENVSLSLGRNGHNASSYTTFGPIDSLFSSAITNEHTSNKFKNLTSTSNNKSRCNSANSTFSMINDTTKSFPFTHESTSTQMSIFTEPSLRQLHEYFLLDKDLEPPDISPISIFTDTVSNSNVMLREKDERI